MSQTTEKQPESFTVPNLNHGPLKRFVLRTAAFHFQSKAALQAVTAVCDKDLLNALSDAIRTCRTICKKHALPNSSRCIFQEDVKGQTTTFASALTIELRGGRALKIMQVRPNDRHWDLNYHVQLDEKDAVALPRNAGARIYRLLFEAFISQNEILSNRGTDNG